MSLMQSTHGGNEADRFSGSSDVLKVLGKFIRAFKKNHLGCDLLGERAGGAKNLAKTLNFANLFENREEMLTPDLNINR